MNDKPIAVLDQQKSRRGLLTLAFAGGAAALAALLGRSNGAQAGHAPSGGNFSSSDGSPAVHGENTDGGPGVQGHSQSGPAVAGFSESGVGGAFSTNSGNGLQVDGRASIVASVASVDGDTLFVENQHIDGGGISAVAQGGHGVEGLANGSESGPGIGVRGVSGDEPFGEGAGVGVQGLSGTGKGVEGVSVDGPGGRFESQNGNAVEGISHSENPFSNGGAFGSQSGVGVGAGSFSGVGVLAGSFAGPAFIGESQNPQKAAVVGASEAKFDCPPDTPCSRLGSGIGVRGLCGSGTGVEGVSLPEGTLVHEGDIGFVFPLEDPLEGPLGSGIGVLGRSGSGPGVQGNSQTGAGVAGNNQSGPGVAGNSQSGPGVQGDSENGPGVFGFSPPGPGVLGGSESAVGVFGFSGPGDTGDGVGGFSNDPDSVGGRFASENGIGLRGVSPGDAKPAVQAASGVGGDQHFTPIPDGGLALEVIGKARFSTAGTGSVPQGESSVFVPNEAVTANSHVTVTLASNPGSRQLHWVKKDPGVGFTVHLTFAPPPQRPETGFTYLIVEPGV